MSYISGIQQRLEEIGLGRMAEVILREVRPSVRLSTGEAGVQPVSRLGGRPNLPEEIRWPVRASGQPLSFIAQLDLAALPTINDVALPEAGSMFFFFDAEEVPWGFDPKDKDGTQVLYSRRLRRANSGGRILIWTKRRASRGSR